MIFKLDMPVGYKFFYPRLQGKEFNFLDVGCSWHSVFAAKRFFPRCHYHGVDRQKPEDGRASLELMSRFYELDLDKDSLAGLPDDYFEVIYLSHLVEHLRHGLDVVGKLCAKLKKGGVIYLEFPGPNSLKAPHSPKGFLHFSDDPSHVRLYGLGEIVNVLLENGLKIEKAGTRRDLVRLAATPYLLWRGLRQGDIFSGRLWDLFGIAEYVFASKP